jgi:RNase P subunit RPR2
MLCKRCGKYIRITTAQKSRVRHENVEIECSCGYLNIVTKADVAVMERKRLQRIGGKNACS